jgi:hypothetical protein
MREVWVESGVAMAHDAGAAVWSFDPDLWGVCIQGTTVDEAVTEFRARFGPVRIVQQLNGDELAFDRDLAPASDAERAATATILRDARARSLALAALPDEVLDWDDSQRALPSFAGWRTIRDTLWHIADTESRYYLPSCGLPSYPRRTSLADELTDSAAHVRDVLESMPRDLVVRADDQVWTSTKLLRRLAWHEPGELVAIDGMLERHWENSRR